MLEVRIDKIEVGNDWGYCGFRPLAGTLPEDFPDRYMSHIPVDREARHLPLALGYRTHAGAVLRRHGRGAAAALRHDLHHSAARARRQPRQQGTDRRFLLYLPVWADGARFSAGDGHGVQGDGEVCINALEICLTGTFTLVLHKGGGERNPLLTYPRAETPTHFITMGMHEDLDLAMKQALRQMISFITGRTNLSKEQAYQFCSLAVDFHVTQTVNGEKGVHGMLRKGLLF